MFYVIAESISNEGLVKVYEGWLISSWPPQERHEIHGYNRHCL